MAAVTGRYLLLQRQIARAHRGMTAPKRASMTGWESDKSALKERL